MSNIETLRQEGNQQQESFASADDFSSLPEVVRQRRENDKEVKSEYEKEVVREDGKEVAGANGKEGAETFAYGLPTSPSGDQAIAPALQHRSSEYTAVVEGIARKRLKWICAAGAFLLVLGIGLGVGLGVGLRPSQPSTRSLAGSDGAGSTSFSTRGAFNGSGIAVFSTPKLSNLTSSQPEQGLVSQSNLLLVFQHYSGEIRWMQRVWPNSWQGGSINEVVATDAKNGTPLSILGGGGPGVQEWQVFYVDQNNMLRQRIIDNTTYAWADGLLNNLDVRVLDADKVGLEACYYSGPIDNVDLNGTEPSTGIRLFVATSETTFDQLAWRRPLPQWVQEQQSWLNLNGHANPTSYNFAPDGVHYVAFVDLQNAVNLYWMDTASNVLSTPSHPINIWTNYPIAGLSGYANLYAKMTETGKIQGWNISYAAENTTAGPSLLSSVDGESGVPNTQLFAMSLPAGASRTGTYEDFVFYQTQGDDITMYLGTLPSGGWNSTTVPIPNL